MIFYRTLASTPEEAVFSVTKDGNKWVLSSSEYGDFTFDNDIVDFKPDVAYLANSYRDGYFLSWSSEVAESRSGQPMSQSRQGIFADRSANHVHLCAFWCGENTTAVDFRFPVYVADAGGDTAVDVGTMRSSLDVFAKYIPEAAPFVQRTRAKQKLIRKINELNAIAALEAQVDLLTAIVLASHPDSDISEALEGVMTSDIHTKEKLLETIKRQKTYLRKLQKTYFEERGEGVSGDPSA